MSATMSIARASARALASHLRLSLGFRSAPWVAGASAAAIAAGFAWFTSRFLQENLAGLFSAWDGSSPQLEAARTAILQAPPLSAGALALIFAMFTTAESSISVVARVNGASRRAVSLGEFIPVAVSVVLASLVTGLGPAIFASSQQRVPMVTMVALLALGVFYAATVLLALRLGIQAGEWLRLGPVLSGFLGVVTGLAVEALALANVLVTVVAGAPSIAAMVSRWFWQGGDIPTTHAAAIQTVAGACVALCAVLGLLALPRSLDSLTVPHRIATLSRLRLPTLIDAVGREILLTLRHPASQFSLVLSVLLATLVVIATVNGLIPRAVCLYACALLLSSAGETIYGRSLPWSWHYRAGGSRSNTRVLVQYAAAVSMALPLGAIVVVVSQAELDVSVWQMVPLTLMLSAAAHLSGIAVPYAASAPTGMLLTSVLALTAETGCLFVTTTVIPPGAPVGALVEVVLAAVLLAFGTIVAKRRGAGLQRV